MSIVGSWNPTNKPSVQDALWHIAFSDNSGQTNFKYIFDIYNQAGTQLARTKIFPNPQNGRGYFDAGSVVRNLITYDWFQPYGIVSWNPDTSGQIAVKYVVRYGEDYNIDASAITQTNMASGEVTAYNFVPGLFDRGITNYTTLENKLLTTRNAKKFYINRNQRFFIGYQTNKALGSSTNITLTKVTSTGEDYQTFSYNYDKSQVVQFDFGTKAISEAFGSFLSNAISYTFEWESQLLTFIIDDCIGKYEPKYLHFMNRFGVYETCEFTLVSKLTSDTERKAFEKSGFEFLTDSVRVKNADNVYMESKINYSQQTNWNYRLTKNFPTDNEWEWAEELIYSPRIYLQEGDYYYPVTLKTNTYERFKQTYAGLRPLELDIEMNQKRNGFLR